MANRDIAQPVKECGGNWEEEAIAEQVRNLAAVQEAEACPDFHGQHDDGCVYREKSFEGD
jgi:hypothetical protein